MDLILKTVSFNLHYHVPFWNCYKLLFRYFHFFNHFFRLQKRERKKWIQNTYTYSTTHFGIVVRNNPCHGHEIERRIQQNINHFTLHAFVIIIIQKKKRFKLADFLNCSRPISIYRYFLHFFNNIPTHNIATQLYPWW